MFKGAVLSEALNNPESLCRVLLRWMDYQMTVDRAFQPHDGRVSRL